MEVDDNTLSVCVGMSVLPYSELSHGCAYNYDINLYLAKHTIMINLAGPISS